MGSFFELDEKYTVLSTCLSTRVANRSSLTTYESTNLFKLELHEITGSFFELDEKHTILSTCLSTRGVGNTISVFLHTN